MLVKTIVFVVFKMKFIRLVEEFYKKEQTLEEKEKKKFQVLVKNMILTQTNGKKFLMYVFHVMDVYLLIIKINTLLNYGVQELVELLKEELKFMILKQDNGIKSIII